MHKGLFILGTDSYEAIYGQAEGDKIRRLVDVYAPPQTSQSVKANPSILREADVIFSGWGGPVMDKDFLDAAPNLKAVFYGAGSIKKIATEVFWKRGILITSAYAANAVPVAEYTLSQILFCLKRGWHYALAIERQGKYPPKVSAPGAYQSTIGIVSLGAIGRLVCRLLQPFDLKVIAFDPHAAPKLARDLKVELRDLEEVFRQADVVSLHSPQLKETEGMITGDHFSSMKENASFINTARGAIVREDEMIAVLRQRPDLTAILDVTCPEPPQEGSPLYKLPNVVLTPHIAGAMGGECRRMGKYMLAELQCWLEGKPLRWTITREKADTMA
ncbi:MAG: hydroxyacid dehydrogenase [Phycisphaerae bacterium]|nr:hydroxyacid dehydrogenase [Phycisphaerae bacterium]